MAHQAHSIPWQTLVGNLKFKHCDPRNHGITNLYLRNTRPNQEKELQYFANGLDRALSAYSAIERTKYNEITSPPEVDERVIPEAAIKKMAQTVLRYKGKYEEARKPSSACEPLSPYECTARRFISDTYPCEGDMDDGRQDVCEQTKTMLLYGEMEPLFRLAAHPSVYFYKLWDEDQYANGHGFGLSKLKDSALQAYICLNVMILKPELYDPASRRTYLDVESRGHRSKLQPDFYDYRLTAAYQRMLLCCTGVPYGSAQYESHAYPHREFFSIPRGMFRFNDPYTGKGRRPPGTGRVSDLVEDQFVNVHVPSKVDVSVALSLIEMKGLPTELALQILELADYKPAGRLSIPDDPLHTKNSDELRRYLSFCWVLLVRIDMLVKASGQWLDWEAEVTNAMYALFGMDGPKRRKMQRIVNSDNEFSRRTQRLVFSEQ